METSTRTNAKLKAIDLELMELLKRDLQLYRLKNLKNEIKHVEIKSAA